MDFVYVLQVNCISGENRSGYILVCDNYNAALCHLIQYIWKEKDNIKGNIVPHSIVDKERFNVVCLGENGTKLSLEIYPLEKEEFKKL